MERDHQNVVCYEKLSPWQQMLVERVEPVTRCSICTHLSGFPQRQIKQKFEFDHSGAGFYTGQLRCSSKFSQLIAIYLSSEGQSGLGLNRPVANDACGNLVAAGRRVNE